MRQSRYLLAFLAGFIAVTAASAQTGGIKVRVFDASDKSPMVGALVTISSAQKKVAETTQLTDGQGVTTFPILAAGSGYVIEAYFDGYGRVRKDDISVKIGSMQEIPIYLSAAEQVVVNVVAQRGSVDLESTTTSTRYGEEFLSDLPIAGRFYQNALTLAPGVQDADGDGNPNVHGARDRDFKATVNGISNQDPLTGQWLSYVNSDSIEEIEVVTAGAGAEFGRAQGGFAQIIQKQGSNDREGVFSMLYQSSKIDGNGATNIPSERLPEFNYYQPAVTFTGPILRDKLWYRLNYEMISQDEPIVLSSAAAAVVSTDLAIYDGQMTWQVSPRNKMSLQYREDALEINNAGVSSFVPPDAAQNIQRGTPTWSLRWTAPYSPKLLVDTQVAYQDRHTDIIPTTAGVPNNCAFGIDVVERSQCFNIETSEVSGSSFIDFHDQSQRLTLTSQAEWYAGRWAGMDHQVKFGLSMENERYFRNQVRRPNTNFFVLRPNSDQDQDPGEEPSFDLVAVIQATFAVPEETEARATGANWTLYAQDTIRPTSNVTINLVARLNREEINAGGFEQFNPEAEAGAFFAGYQDPAQCPGGDSQPCTDANRALINQVFTAYEGLQGYAQAVTDYLGGNVSLDPAGIQSGFWEKTRRPSNMNIVNTNFEPRISVKWDPWNDGKTSFYATAGRYYDKIFLQVPLVESEPITTTVVFDARQEPTRPGQWIVDPSTDPINPALNTSVVSRDLRTPYKDEFSIGFEREILQETVLRVKYIRSHFKDQLQDININKLPADYGRCRIQQIPSEDYIVASPGSGDTLIDPFSGDSYVDTDPGNGDGRLDDCAGENVALEDSGGGGPGGSGRDSIVFRPDGIADLYILNPAWGDVYLVGNFNSQKYSGVEVQLQRRLYKNWEMEASYTWSRAIGDAEDFQLALGDDRSTLQDERGFLSYDQRHVVKLNATTLTPWGVRLGTRVTWQSGLPYSILRRDFSYSTTPPVYAGLASPDSPVRTRYSTGQRNDQRNTSYWNFDVKATKEFSLPKGMNMQVSAEIFNLLNEDTYFVYNNFLNYGQQVNGINDDRRDFGRTFQLGMRLSF